MTDYTSPVTCHAEKALPWWAPAIPADAPLQRLSWCDLWDALFGRVETFYRVELDGSWCICDAGTMDDMTEGHKGYIVTQVRMTRRQFEALPEFEGF